MKKTPTYDVVIIGGGPAGCATAMQLLQNGIRSVLILEKGSYRENRVGESLPPNTNLLLHKLGIWDAFQAEKHLPVHGSCSLWGSSEPGYNDFLLNPHGPGWHLDRRRFDGFMAEQAQKQGAKLRIQTRFIQVETAPDQSGYLLHLENDAGILEQVFAHFVVDASGIQGSFARKMGAEKNIHDRLIFVSGFFDLPDTQHLSSSTMLEAAEYGWWYLAVLPGKRIIAALATDLEILKQRQLSERAPWLAHLSETRLLGTRFSALSNELGALVVSPAFSGHLDRACGHNWLAVGDAAAAYDPICSLGIYKSLLSGMQAGQTIAAYKRQTINNLQPYQDFLEEDFKKYRKARDYFYDLENSWPEAAFGMRRKGVSGTF